MELTRQGHQHKRVHLKKGHPRNNQLQTVQVHKANHQYTERTEWEKLHSPVGLLTKQEMHQIEHHSNSPSNVASDTM